MKTKNLALIVILGAVLILGGCACSGYNGIVSEDVKVNKTWSDVQAEYQKRNDLVGQLVETVKGAAKFEQSTYVAVTEARSKASSMNISADSLTPEKLAQFQAAQSQVSGSLSRLLATVENYPQLKATENFSKLQGQLEGIENDVKNSRKIFNEAVQGYNLKVRSFPMNIFAGMFGFKQKEGFKAEAGAEKAPEVKF
ncbi:MAG: LemA family protein [Chitinophagaceae bacterium]